MRLLNTNFEPIYQAKKGGTDVFDVLLFDSFRRCLVSPMDYDGFIGAYKAPWYNERGFSPPECGGGKWFDGK